MVGTVRGGVVSDFGKRDGSEGLGGVVGTVLGGMVSTFLCCLVSAFGERDGSELKWLLVWEVEHLPKHLSFTGLQ